LLIAFALPTFVVNVIAGSVAAALIPTVIRVREQESRVAAQAVFSASMILGAILLCASGHVSPC